MRKLVARRHEKRYMDRKMLAYYARICLLLCQIFTKGWPHIRGFFTKWTKVHILWIFISLPNEFMNQVATMEIMNDSSIPASTQQGQADYSLCWVPSAYTDRLIWHNSISVIRQLLNGMLITLDHSQDSVTQKPWDWSESDSTLLPLPSTVPSACVENFVPNRRMLPTGDIQESPCTGTCTCHLATKSRGKDGGWSVG